MLMPLLRTVKHFRIMTVQAKYYLKLLKTKVARGEGVTQRSVSRFSVMLTDAEQQENMNSDNGGIDGTANW